MSFRLLVVEDDADVRRVIVRALRQSGIRLEAVHEAGDGAAGLRLLREHNIDFVLADLDMPVMSGPKMVEEMRRDPDLEKIPVVFISGEEDEARAGRSLRQTAGFIHKPFTAQKLAETVMNMIADAKNPLGDE